MIYLIGGPPRCGKTTVAKLLSKKLDIPWISTHTLESIVSVTLKQAYGAEDKGITEAFPKDEIRKATEHSNDRMYTEYTPEEIAQAYIKQAGATSEAISR